ncbi:glycoside hydrolase family 3 C-terminal domain-containing protein [Glycomyces sp. L485]|uniref:glycoside hydrolase family 3 protein n=1 Tax=Glycomyces sp. L485 TaxID=2909235 RepID=UPI001F4A4C6E|nr:glycoside hydrolase family 3 protein [Glycomyces sp. L485]MCH7230788.1 glycoside hydrolase family 3 C-terminal domain-containing protein [Glycomyces sp. L485]
MTMPFQDAALARPKRVADLLSRLTLDEKLGLLHQYQAPIERLGIGPFRTGTEVLHGVAWLGEATVFPQVVALGAAWNPGLVERIGRAVADELLAKHRTDPVNVGRNVWAPTVNPLRDPRWGRNEEGYSEDAWATGLLSSAYARGLKSDNGSAWKTAPTVKHFLAYGHEIDRGTVSSSIPPRVLHEYEFVAQRAAIAGGDAVGAMLSYNLVNGRPAHANPLVNAALRTWTDDEVLVVSDAYGPSMMTADQGYYEDLLGAYTAAVKAGLDSFTQDDERSDKVIAVLREALDRGLLTEAEIDTAAGRNLHVRFGLGEFDAVDPFAGLGAEALHAPVHQALAREAAVQSITLLKNDGLLPLKAPERIAVIGPLGDTQMIDWYSGTPPYTVTARQALGKRAAVVHTEGLDRVRLRHKGRYLTVRNGTALTDATGPEAQFDLYDWGGRFHFVRNLATGNTLSGNDDCEFVAQPSERMYAPIDLLRFVELPDGTIALHQFHPNDWTTGGKWVTLDGDRLMLTADANAAIGFEIEVVASGGQTAAELARGADAAIVVLGNHPAANARETQDRADLALPEAQERLLRAVTEANPATVLVLASSYPFAIDWAAEHVPAIVWSGHGGQEWGHALAAVLYGERDPEGRLPQTWYSGTTELPAIHDCDIIAGETTYLYHRERPLYPFGHGGSYADFAYADLRVDRERARPGDQVTVTVEVANRSDRDGVEVVQLYSHQHESRVKQPLRQLRGFEKLRLAAGESRTVSLTVAVDDLAHWDNVTGRMVVERSAHRLMVGRSATDLLLSASVEIDGEVIAARDLSRSLAANANDAYSGVLWRDESRASGDVLAAETAGGWIKFGGCDFRPGYATVTARVAGRASRLVLRAVDPVDGEVLAIVDTPGTGGVYEYTEVTAELARLGRVEDLYVVFEAEGVRLSSLAFGGAGR